MGELKRLVDHDLYAERSDGFFVGRCREWPRLKTKRFRDKLDAIDAITALVAKHLRDIHGEMPIRRAGGR